MLNMPAPKSVVKSTIDPQSPLPESRSRVGSQENAIQRNTKKELGKFGDLSGLSKRLWLFLPKSSCQLKLMVEEATDAKDYKSSKPRSKHNHQSVFNPHS